MPVVAVTLNASCVPSGDQSMPPTLTPSGETRRAVWVARSRIQSRVKCFDLSTSIQSRLAALSAFSCGVSGSALRKAIRLPSGDQAMSPMSFGSAVSGTASPPASGNSQICRDGSPPA